MLDKGGRSCTERVFTVPCYSFVTVREAASAKPSVDGRKL